MHIANSDDSNQKTHPIECDECGKRNVDGTRYKCLVCRDFDLCESCHTSKKHGEKHSMVSLSSSICDTTAIKETEEATLQAYQAWMDHKYQDALSQLKSIFQTSPFFIPALLAYELILIENPQLLERPAQYYMPTLLLAFGREIPQDWKDHAIQFLQGQVDKDKQNSTWITVLGTLYDEILNQKEEAVVWLRKGAEMGNSIAQNSLGLCLLNGEGIEEDPEQSLSWLQKSSQQKNPRGQASLAWAYLRLESDNVQPHLDNVLELFGLSAQRGDPLAQNSLGFCYQNGIGGDMDLVAAFRWFEKGANAGYDGALHNMGYCFQNGEGAPRIDPAKAVECYQLSAEQGYPMAQFNLAYCLEKGIGVGKDVDMAVRWYHRAAAQGDEDAQARLKALGYMALPKLTAG